MALVWSPVLTISAKWVLVEMGFNGYVENCERNQIFYL
jgi:hypothetical protein